MSSFTMSSMLKNKYLALGLTTSALLFYVIAILIPLGWISASLDDPDNSFILHMKYGFTQRELCFETDGVTICTDTMDIENEPEEKPNDTMKDGGAAAQMMAIIAIVFSAGALIATGLRTHIPDYDKATVNISAIVGSFAGFITMMIAVMWNFDTSELSEEEMETFTLDPGTGKIMGIIGMICSMLCTVVFSFNHFMGKTGDDKGQVEAISAEAQTGEL